jgi:hypothetical protein
MVHIWSFVNPLGQGTPDGQAAAQAPQPLHSTSVTSAFPVFLFIFMALVGQTASQ